MSRIEFMARYLQSARAAGFTIAETPSGCVYAADDDNSYPIRLEARPCFCGCPEGWGMFAADEPEMKS